MRVADYEKEMVEVEDAADLIYEQRLRAKLERDSLGKAVAIHPDSGDYAVGSTHREAAEQLIARDRLDGRIVTLTIGPPTKSDLRIANLLTRRKF